MAFEHVAAPGPQAPKYCTQCGQRLPPGDVRFCAYCGAAIQLPVAPTDETAAPRDRTPWGYADMAMAIAVVIGSVIIVLIPIIFIIGIVAGGEIDDDDEPVTAVTIGAGFLLEAVLILAVALFTVRKYNLRWSELGFRLPKRGGYWFPVPIFLAAFALLLVNAGIASAVGADAEGNVSDELFDSALLIVLLGILSLGLAPIMEETFFRGFLFGGLRGRWGLLVAAIASGLLFALAHFTGLSSLPLLPAIGMIGMLFAWSYHYTGSLFAPIGGHFLFNLAAFIVGVSGVAT